MVQAALLSSQRRRRDAHGKGCQERPCGFVVEIRGLIKLGLTYHERLENWSWRKIVGERARGSILAADSAGHCFVGTLLILSKDARGGMRTINNDRF